MSFITKTFYGGFAILFVGSHIVNKTSKVFDSLTESVKQAREETAVRSRSFEIDFEEEPLAPKGRIVLRPGMLVNPETREVIYFTPEPVGKGIVIEDTDENL